MSKHIVSRYVTVMGDEQLDKVTALAKNTEKELNELANLLDELSKMSSTDLSDADFLLSAAGFRLRRVAEEHATIWDELKDTSPYGLRLDIPNPVTDD